jgi:hypothetical protein
MYFYLTYNDMSSYPAYLVIQWEGVYDITLDPAMVSPKFQLLRANLVHKSSILGKTFLTTKYLVVKNQNLVAESH